jgi:hypothetical protein
LKNNKLPIFLAAYAILFTIPSCKDGITNYLNRPLGDPVAAKPKVDSFSKEGSIRVSWDSDYRADEFILERAADVLPYVFEKKYGGSALSYQDSDLGANEARYLYRLSKRRGDKVFSTEESRDLWALGVRVPVANDPYEPNDTEEKATGLDNEILANSFFYESTTGDQIQDVDWYKVKIPAHKTAGIILSDPHPPSPSGTHFCYQIPEDGQKGSAIQQVGNMVEFQIINTTNAEKEYLFRIFPDPGQYLLVTANGEVADYDLLLSRIF